MTEPSQSTLLASLADTFANPRGAGLKALVAHAAALTNDQVADLLATIEAELGESGTPPASVRICVSYVRGLIRQLREPPS